MKNTLRKSFSALLAVILVCTLLPLGAAALPAGLEYDTNGKVIPANTDIRTAGSLADGEVYTYTTVTDTTVTGAALPYTDFTVGLSALGQKYKTTTTSTQSFNIVFVLDVSGSMRDNSKITTLKQTANNAIATLTTPSDNKIAVVTFSEAADDLVGLTSDSFTLGVTGSGTGTYLYKDTNGNSSYNSGEPSSNVNGGTNIQAGINKAYTLLNAASNKATAIPVIILLSDGVPCYYWSNLTGIYTSSGYSQDGDGSGNGTTSNGGILAASYTIKQAAYLKTLMPSLQIYTIGFETTSNALATATLNPTTANVASVTGYGSNRTPLSSYLSGYGDNRYYYPNGAYTASNSVSSLQTALTNVITQINQNTPIAETTVSGVLSPVSFVTMSYQVGTGYYLPDSTMTVSLNGTSYTLTKHGTSYTYDVASSTPGYNAALTKLVLTVVDGVVTWQIPASVLPCNTPEPTGSETQTLATPVTLYFTLRFDENTAGLTAQTYPTSSSITASFYPTGDNPFYYTAGSTGSAQSLAENTTNTYTLTDYYKAIYPYPGNDDSYQNNNLPTLTGFGLGSSSSGPYTYTSLSNVNVTGFTDNFYKDWKDAVTMRYTNPSDSSDVRSITFPSSTKMTATLSLTTSDKSNVNAYTVTSFNDGSTSYPDAHVTAVNGNNVTITYGETGDGPRSVTFNNVSFSQSVTNGPGTITATFRGYYGGSSYIKSLSIVEVNDVELSTPISVPVDEEDDYYGGYDYFYNLSMQINGNWYKFASVRLQYGVSNYSYNYDVTGNEYHTTYTASNITQYYYSTTASTSHTVTENVENYRFLYDNASSPTYLTVQVKSGGVWTTEGSYAEGANTDISPNGQGGFTVKQNSGGALLTTTTYSVASNTLYKQVTTTGGQNSVNLMTGIVTHTLTVNGAMVLNESLSASECLPSATLKSRTGTNLATADSSGVAYVVLHLTVSSIAGTIRNPAVTLDYSASTAPDSFTYDLVDSSGNSISLPTTLSPGTYELIYKTVATYSDSQAKPDYYTVYLKNISFSLSSGTSRQLIASDDTTLDTDQQVKVVLITEAGH